LPWNHSKVDAKTSSGKEGCVNVIELKVDDYEKVVVGREPESNYHGIIAVHSTVLGPGTGGTRFWNYTTPDEALRDALRLSRGMTYKNSLADLPLGGGKSVILGDNKTKDRERVFRAHGRLIESLNGKYIAAEDVGTSPSDMEFVNQETRHVGGLASTSGDPSPVTARGVFRAMQAAARYRWGSDNLSGKTVAIQGLGHVGYALAEHLHQANAKLIVCDVDDEPANRAVGELGATRVNSNDIFAVAADIFAPCALGGILNDDTIPRLRVEMIVGAANNQLLEPRHGHLLRQRNILYAPDYAANAGGIMSYGTICANWTREFLQKKVDAIYDTLINIFAIADREGIPTNQAADRLAEQRLMKPAQAAD
jgi:leucine dehydrogenase